MDDKYQVYLITNTINNKKYVGQTSKKRSYLVRFAEHKRNSSKKTNLLYSAMRHYGTDNFKIELLEDNVDISQIDDREKYYIELYRTYYLAENSQGYNMTTGGQGIHGVRFTDDVKSCISKSSKCVWERLRTVDIDKLCSRNATISDKLTGRAFTPEHRRKLSESAKLRVGERNTFYGKHHTDETKRKIAACNGHPVCMCDKDTGEVIREFESAAAACRYLLEQGKTTNKKAFTRIITVCEGTHGQGRVAYGYSWKYKR